MSHAQVADQFADQRWRLANLYYITNEKGQKVHFEPNWAQQQLLDEMWFTNLILKARQLGFTTFIDLFMLDSCVFDFNVRAGIIAHNLDDAEAIFRDKVRFPYDNLPEGIRTANPATRDAAKQLSFANNSSLRVGTSLRSGTLQYLHVSEFGKIAAQYPEKAREIRTGAFNTVHPGQFVFVESTAEGQEGDFFEMCEVAQAKQRQGEKLTHLDFKFFFFSWWKHPAYTLAEEVAIPAEMRRYFQSLADKGIHLTDGQKAWYVKKAESQREDMKREFPSTPEEAFEGSVEGTYYADLLAKADRDGRITNVPHDEVAPVETWWDLGVGDVMAIWFVQRIGAAFHVIDYYANAGEGLAHYAAMLEERARSKANPSGYRYERHLWPHDGNHRVLDETARRKSDIAAGLGIEVEIVERGLVHVGIEAVRSSLSRCWFDKEKCSSIATAPDKPWGLEALRNYRKEWDEHRGTWKKTPLHNWASHAADAFRTGMMADTPSPGFWGDVGKPKVRIV